MREEFISKMNLLKVLFEDTVFFPEGGGQNTDKGNIGDSQVDRV